MIRSRDQVRRQHFEFCERRIGQAFAARTWGAAAGDGKQRRPYHEHAEADHICMNLKAANPTQILIHLGQNTWAQTIGRLQSETDDNESEPGECGQ